LILTVFVLAPGMALAAKTRDYLIESKPMTLEWNKEHEGWVSPGCHTEGKCEALRLLPLAKSGNLVLRGGELAGGKNPGSVICKKLSAKVVFGSPKEGGGRMSFCQAGDGSLIPNSFLTRTIEGNER
jgi:hypothetical protein